MSQQLEKQNRQAIYYFKNKDKILAKRKQRYQKNKEKELEKAKEYRKNNRECLIEYQAEFYKQNKEKVLARRKRYYEQNKEKELLKRKQRYEQNKEKELSRKKEYRINNKEKIKEYHKNHRDRKNLLYKERRENDNSFLIAERIRSSFKKMMSVYSKTGKIYSIRKYDIDINAIVEHLGQKPQDGKQYDIDHIFPVSAFDLENPEHIRLCWHPDNLQWMEHIENIRKNDNYDKEAFEKYITTIKI